jgi:hypothetical protein
MIKGYDGTAVQSTYCRANQSPIGHAVRLLVAVAAEEADVVETAIPVRSVLITVAIVEVVATIVIAKKVVVVIVIGVVSQC